MGREAGWYADPSRRHQLRWFDGSQWTEHVADHGTQAVDSFVPEVPPPPPLDTPPEPALLSAQSSTTKASLWTRYSALSLKARLAIGAAVFVIVLGIIAVATSAGNSKTDDDRTAATRSAESTAKTTTSTIATTTTAPRPTTTTAPVAALRAAMNAEADRACKEAQATGEPPQVRYSPSWSRTGTSSAELQFMVAACVQQAIDAQLAGAGPIDVDGVTKNPDAYTGQVFVIVVEISQFDAATGPCSFRAYWDNADHQYTFDYAGDNAYFSSGDGDSSCPILDGIDQEDVVRVWVRSTGSLSYETTLGGSTTVPSFEVLKAELIRNE